ncbi:MAG: hypothetical protein AB7O88_13030 [Reyranellaceae bacterium]
MRLGSIFAIFLALLTSACINTGDRALDAARWNAWPLESIGYHEEAPGRVAIAAIIHRGGLREVHDELALRITIDRLLRYAAKLANDRKAPRFAIEPELYGWHYTASRAGIVLKDKVYPYIRAVTTFPDTAKPASANAYVFETGAIMAAPKEPLLTLPPGALR